MWWPATVIEVFQFEVPKNGCVGKGKLLYKKFKKYCEEEADVEFVYTPRKGQLVVQSYDGKKLQMTWACPEEAHKIIDKSRRTSAGSTFDDYCEPRGIQSRMESSALIGESTKGRIKTENLSVSANDVENNSTRAKIPTNSTDHLKGSGSSRKTGAEHMVVGQQTPGEDQIPKTFSGLDGSTAYFFEHLLSNACNYTAKLVSDSFHDQLMRLVIHELRIDVVTELHRSFKASNSAQKQNSDLQQKCLRTSVSCPLQTFSALARFIHERPSSTGLDETSVQFFPEFSQTQNPSVSSERFTIYFPSVHSLSSAVGFNDNRDFETLFFRERCHDSTYLTRIIGSLDSSSSGEKVDCADTKSSSTTLVVKKSCTSSSAKLRVGSHTSDSSVTQHKHGDASARVDTIYVGLSLNASLSVNDDVNSSENLHLHGSATGLAHVGPSRAVDDASLVKQESRVTSSCGVEQIDNCLALTRKRTLWDDESNTHLSQWESQSSGITVQPPPPSFFSCKTKKLEGVFALRWEPKYIPRTSAWTSDALRSDNHILGKLEIFIPWVLLIGDQCAEVGDILCTQSFKIR